jgi:hypothetical protein
LLTFKVFCASTSFTGIRHIQPEKHLKNVLNKNKKRYIVKLEIDLRMEMTPSERLREVIRVDLEDCIYRLTWKESQVEYVREKLRLTKEKIDLIMCLIKQNEPPVITENGPPWVYN